VTARRHHFVSQCYLKNFAGPHKKVPQIHVYDRVSKTAFRTGIDNVGAERDFNRFEAEGQQPDAFENSMAGFEGELDGALGRIIATRSLSNDDDRAYLLNFIGLQALRNPRLREMMRSALEQTAKITMDLILSSRESYERHVKATRAAGSVVPEVPYEEMKKFFKSEQYRVEANREAQIEREMQVFENTLPLLFRRGWRLLRAPGRSGGFITSDHPFTLMWSDPKMRGGFYGPGLALPNTEIVFPISPALAVIGAFEIENGEQDVNDVAVASLNGATIAYAKRQVYALDPDFKYSMQYDEPLRTEADLMTDSRFLYRRAEPKSEPQE
jgi:hypothetical protein